MSLGISSSLVPSGESLSPLGQTRSPQSVERDRVEFSHALDRAQKTTVARTHTARRAVPRQKTPLSGEQAASALGQAWEQALGSPPTQGTLSVLTAQWAHETGRGQSMMNFNFGGIKGTGPTGLTATYGTHEGWGETKQHIQDGFRAYESAEEGAADYVSLLVRRYPDAVNAAEQQDPAAFVEALGNGGYFTGNRAAYTRSVTSLANQANSDGYGALGSTPGALSTTNAFRPSFAPSTQDYLSSSFFAGLDLNPTGGESWQSVLSADEVSRVTLLMSTLPAFSPDSGSEDPEKRER